MISKYIANKYADKDCLVCEGEGIVREPLPDGDSEYCLCVLENRAEAEADNRLAEVV